MDDGALVRFRDGVSCRREEGPLGLTLIGRTSDRPDEIATLSFAGGAPADLPEALEEATVQRIDVGHYRIRSGKREWAFAARSAHLHREVATTFYRAIVPRSIPWKKRLFWRVLLALAASKTGRRILMALRRR